MNKRILLLLLSIYYFNGGTVTAQDFPGKAATYSSNNEIDKSVITGHFEVEVHKSNSTHLERINVNYSISPAPFINILTLELNTPDPVMFNVTITDKYGKSLTKWAAQKQDYRYSDRLDISGLVPGNYKVNVFWDRSPGLLYSIPFQKLAK